MVREYMVGYRREGDRENGSCPAERGSEEWADLGDVLATWYHGDVQAWDTTRDMYEFMALWQCGL